MKVSKLIFRGCILLALLSCLAAQQALAATVFVGADIAASETWTANNEYILTKPIYVTSGATLTIEAGTVIRGEGESAPGANDPGTLIITRGAKIHAAGTALKPIVFTDLFDDNVGNNAGSFPYDNPLDALSLTGQWGGLVILGRTYVANNSSAGANAAREVQVEGLTAAGGLGLYGNCAASPLFPNDCDDDDSGSLSYVSIRYGGFNLSANNEINGLTMGAVGRETDVHHIEIFQNKDDGIEFFGGTAGVKHLIVSGVGDDGVDYDEGFRGKLQFVFVMQSIPGTDKSDKGGEHDGGNAPDASLPLTIPTFYNATYVGHGQKAFTDAAKNTAIHFRDNAGGRYYNSLFADFAGAPFLIEGSGANPTDVNTSGERAITAYSQDAFQTGPDSDFQLELQDNEFWCFGNGGAVPTGAAAQTAGGDAGKLHYDNGAFSNASLDNDYVSCVGAKPIRTLDRFVNPDPTRPNPVVRIDPRAASAAVTTTDRTAPDDGFFSVAPFKGAFGESNWASGWSTMSRLGYFPACDTRTGVDVAPDEVTALTFDDKSSISWTAPALTGGMGYQVYELLRVSGTEAADALGFSSSPDCPGTELFDTEATDATDPAGSELFFYLVRAKNGCGVGPLGRSSAGAERVGDDCP